jgi:hypothetical protein
MEEKSHEALQGITCEVKSSAKIWKHIEKTIKICHFPSFGPRNKLFPQAHVSKYLESYIGSNRKDIRALPEINESTIQRFIEAPTRHITLIKTILPKMEKYEKRISQSITSYKASLQQHTFSHGETISLDFEAWVAFVRKWRRERDEASSSQIGGHLIEESLNSPKGKANNQVEGQDSQRESNPLRGKEDEVIRITNRQGGEMNSHPSVSSS